LSFLGNRRWRRGGRDNITQRIQHQNDILVESHTKFKPRNCNFNSEVFFLFSYSMVEGYFFFREVWWDSSESRVWLVLFRLKGWFFW
jgi:hypothetical protein